MGHHSCCNKQKVKRGLWSPEEDEKLINYISSYGHGCWSSVPRLAGNCFFPLEVLVLSESINVSWVFFSPFFLSLFLSLPPSLPPSPSPNYVKAFSLCSFSFSPLSSLKLLDFFHDFLFTFAQTFLGFTLVFSLSLSNHFCRLTPQYFHGFLFVFFWLNLDGGRSAEMWKELQTEMDKLPET